MDNWWGECPLVLDGLGLEEAVHPALVEALHAPVDGPRRDSGLLDPLHGWRAEHDDGPNQLVHALLRPVELELELLPVIGGLEQRSFATGHPRSYPSRRQDLTTGPSG